MKKLLFTTALIMSLPVLAETSTTTTTTSPGTVSERTTTTTTVEKISPELEGSVPAQKMEESPLPGATGTGAPGTNLAPEPVQELSSPSLAPTEDTILPMEEQREEEVVPSMGGGPIEKQKMEEVDYDEEEDEFVPGSQFNNVDDEEEEY